MCSIFPFKPPSEKGPKLTDLVFIFWLLFLPFIGFSQDSLWTVDIDSIVVKSTRLQFESIGTNSYIVPPTPFNNATVGDALSYATPISLRQYGPGMLQSVSARGTGASHVGVNWNGINIQSSSHGQVDFGLLSINEQLSYTSGGNSAMSGSGNLGGLVRLKSKLRHKEGIHGSLGFSLASFENQDLRSSIHFTKKKWSSNSSINYKNGKNNFPFTNTVVIGQPVQDQVNNHYEAINFRQSNQWLVNHNNVLDFHYWLTKSYRQIPPNMTSANDYASQDDQSHRFMFDWLLSIKRNLNLQTKLAHFTEQLTFKNTAIYAFTATSKQILDSRLNLKKGNHQLLIGLFQSYEKASSDGYGLSHQRYTSAFSIADNFSISNRLKLSVQARMEAIDFSSIIPIFSLASEYDWRHFKLTAKFGRHFHAPTFNDLFWQDLGNPSLKSEIGYQSDCTIGYQSKNSSYRFSTSLTGFWLRVDDWINWAPDDTGIWRPNNNKKVDSKGIESTTSISYIHANYRLTADMGYTYVHSINKESSHSNILIGKQLLYVPRHKGNTQISVSYKDVSLDFQQVLVGKSPRKLDNSHYVPGYGAQNLRLAYRKSIKAIEFGTHFSITNIGNKNYQVIHLFPMPGRGFEGGISLGF